MPKLKQIKLVLSILGIFISLYLVYVRITAVHLSCGFGDCLKVQSSSYAVFLGIPLAYWGLIYYFVLFCLVYKSVKLTKLWVLWGLLFSLYLLALEVLVIHAICMWCMLSFLIIIAISLIEFGKGVKRK